MAEKKLKDDALGIENTESEAEPFNFWEKKQRELLTSVVDYNLSTLAELVGSKNINLSPTYQRRFRWDAKRQSSLIESFLMNVPVPPIYLNEDEYGEYSIIDGKQRLTAVYKYLSGEFQLQGLKVFADINGLRFDQLPAKMQNVLKTRAVVRAVIVLRQSDPDVKYEVFRRLNSGGVKLNAQEIRNSAYPGILNDLIIRLSETSKFHQLLGIKNKEQSRIYQEMRDAELVLRYFTFRNIWKNFDGGVGRLMDKFMDDNKKMSDVEIMQLNDDFLYTLEVVEACFGKQAFQRWLPENQQWRQQVLASLYDAQMLACRGLSIDKAKSNQERIIEEFKKLFTDSEFRKSIDVATSTPSFFKHRVLTLQEMLKKIIKQK